MRLCVPSLTVEERSIAEGRVLVAIDEAGRTVGTVSVGRDGDDAELALMFASRAQQIDELILPAVEAGKWVLCDRFTDSSEAYQGGGRELGSEVVLDMHRIICRGLQPDMTILMDSEVEASVARARRRNLNKADSAERDENRFEQENRKFFERVHDKYLKIAAREPGRVLLVDARQVADVVAPLILAEVRERLMGTGAAGS